MKQHIKDMIKAQKMKQQQFDEEVAALENEVMNLYGKLGRLEAAIDNDAATLKEWETKA